MTNDVSQDGQPHKKSIRNIPLPENRRRIVTVDADDAHHHVPAPQRHHEPVHDERLARPADDTLRVTRRESTTYAHSTPPVVPDRPVRARPEEQEEEVYTAPASVRPRRTAHKRRSFTLVSIGVIVVALVGMFFAFGGATVTVYPRQVTTMLSAEIDAYSISAPTTSAALVFAAEELTAEATRRVEATGEEEVVEKATGRITIVNEYSEEDQRLLKNTRFESPEGLIFRIPDSVVVPGLTRDASGNVVPGTLEAEVLADQPGAEYNIGPARFSVPGFEGMPQYASFYATSKNAMVGGFDGIKKIVSAEDRNRAERELRAEIKEQLTAKAQALKTETRLALTDDSLTLYETLEEQSEGDTVTLGMRGTTKVVSIGVDDLAYVLAQADLNSFTEGDRVRITNLDELRMRVFAKTGDSAGTAVRIAVEGDATFEWLLDETAFLRALGGIQKDELSKTVESFKAITKADAKIRPIWKRTFSENPDKISIVYATEE